MCALLVEQNVSLACGAADEVLEMNKGQLAWQGGPTTCSPTNRFNTRTWGFRTVLPKDAFPDARGFAGVVPEKDAGRRRMFYECATGGLVKET